MKDIKRSKEMFFSFDEEKGEVCFDYLAAYAMFISTNGLK